MKLANWGSGLAFAGLVLSFFLMQDKISIKKKCVPLHHK